MNTEEGFNAFLAPLIERIKEKSIQLNRESWTLETDGSAEKAKTVARTSTDLKLIYSDKETYEQLLDWRNAGTITCPELLRILNELICKFKGNLAPEELLSSIATLEADISQTYSTFRSCYQNQEVSENDLLEILRCEQDIEKRKEAWRATKKVGLKLAPLLLKTVKLRNQLAHRLGYSDFYKMKLELSEVDPEWLSDFLQKFNEETKESYLAVSKEIQKALAEKFQISESSIGPWAYSDPFAQEDPLLDNELNELIQEIDPIATGHDFFKSMGFDVSSILQNSDLLERPKKCQHAFCSHIDREGDVRILCNVRPNIYWVEVVLHELGHAVYEKGFDPKLNWFLKTPPHMISTEAIALIMGRQAYDPSFLSWVLKDKISEELLQKIQMSQVRRQLLFSRWVMVMVQFESSMYANPEQDLNELWWRLVQEYQRITPPSFRGEDQDWACKCHLGIAPVYYHNYLLGEFLASMVKSEIHQETQATSFLNQKYCSKMLNEKFFSPGNLMAWDRHILKVFKRPFEYQSWISDFCLPLSEPIEGK